MEPSESFTQLTVLLTQRSVAALEEASIFTDDSRTDVANRALQVYCFLMQELRKGKGIFVRDTATGEMEEIRFQ